MRSKLIEALLRNQDHFGLNLSAGTLGRLADYYDLVMANNHLLHLVAPCSADDFALRHLLESIAMAEFLPPKAAFADVGAGAGLPSMPCLIARPDLRAVLIESKPKKAAFLSAAIVQLGLEDRAGVVNKQFTEAPKPDVDFIACRALDGFQRRLPQLLKWAGPKPLLLFGGPELEANLIQNQRIFRKKLLPLSERRFLFFVAELRRN